MTFSSHDFKFFSNLNNWSPQLPLCSTCLPASLPWRVVALAAGTMLGGFVNAISRQGPHLGHLPKKVKTPRQVERDLKVQGVIQEELKGCLTVKQKRNQWNAELTGSVLHRYSVAKAEFQSEAKARKKATKQARALKPKQAKSAGKPKVDRSLGVALSVYVEQGLNSSKDMAPLATCQEMVKEIKWMKTKLSEAEVPFPWTKEQFCAYAQLYKDNKVQRKKSAAKNVRKALLKKGAIEFDEVQPPRTFDECAMCENVATHVCSTEGCGVFCQSCATVFHALPLTRDHKWTRIPDPQSFFVPPSVGLLSGLYVQVAGDGDILTKHALSAAFATNDDIKALLGKDVDIQLEVDAMTSHDTDIEFVEFATHVKDSISPKDKTSWACTVCTLRNGADHTACRLCKKTKARKRGAPPAVNADTTTKKIKLGRFTALQPASAEPALPEVRP